MSDRPQVHTSDLLQYLICPHKYYLVHLERRRQWPSTSMIRGIAVDRAATATLQAKIDTGLTLPTEQVRDIARAEVVKEFDAGHWLAPKERAAGETGARKQISEVAGTLATAYNQAAAPGITPVRLQSSFTLTISGYPADLAGTPDVEAMDNGKLAIRDTKTRGRRQPLAVHENVALTTYALYQHVKWDNPYPVNVTEDVLLALKRPEYEPITSERDEEDVQNLLRLFETILEATQKEIFPPRHLHNYLCSPEQCGFWGTEHCRYTRRIGVLVNKANLRKSGGTK